eukprot:7756720-Pyramimonas_sp.AAC.1
MAVAPRLAVQSSKSQTPFQNIASSFARSVDAQLPLQLQRHEVRDISEDAARRCIAWGVQELLLALATGFAPPHVRERKSWCSAAPALLA